MIHQASRGLGSRIPDGPSLFRSRDHSGDSSSGSKGGKGGAIDTMSSSADKERGCFSAFIDELLDSPAVGVSGSNGGVPGGYQKRSGIHKGMGGVNKEAAVGVGVLAAQPLATHGAEMKNQPAAMARLKSEMLFIKCERDSMHHEVLLFAK